MTFQRKTICTKALGVFLALLLLLPGASLLSVAFAADGAVSIRFSAYDPNSGFFAFDQPLSVAPGTAARYGLENASAGHEVGGVDHGVAENQVSPLDAIVAMHEMKYGDAFTADTIGDYLIGASSYITGMFGVDASSTGIGYAVNSDLPMGDMSDGYAINEYVLKNNDSLYFFIYADEYVGDYLASFDRTAVTVDAGESFSLTLSAFMAMEAMFVSPGSPTPEEHMTMTTIPDAAICLVDPATGALGAAIGGTDDDGEVTLSFAEAGTYYVSAMGFEPDYDYPITAPVCTVTVNGAQQQEYLASFKFTNGTGASAAAYPMAASDDPAYDYVITVPDYVSAFGAWATLSEDAPEGSAITAVYTSTANAARTQAITSGKATGQNLAQCIATGCKGNDTLVLKVGVEGDMQEYRFKIVRNLTLTALSAQADGTALIMDQAFNRDTASYTTNVPATVNTVDVSATTYGAASTGYVLSINGETADGTANIPLTGDSTAIPVVVSAEGAVAGTYTLTVNKVPTAEVTFNITPADANLMVFDAANTLIVPNDGVYSLMSGVEYTYTVAKYGYVGVKQSFAAAAGAIDVTLSAAEPNPDIDPAVTAQWKDFRNSDVNMAITDVATPVSPETTELTWNMKLGTGWAANPSVQIIVDDTLIVMLNSTLYKLNLADGSVLQSATMAAAPNFGYTPPTYAAGMIFVPLSGGKIQAFNAKTLESLWLYTDARGGQSLSPISYSDGYLYTGFWNSETAVANYACISVTDEDPSSANEAKIPMWTKAVPGGFYWAGSVIIGDAVIFGTDDGTSGFDGASSHLYSLNKYTGAVISDLPIVGDQRSSIAYDTASGRIYFTTKCGYLYSAAIDPATGVLSDLKGVNNHAQCTATPIVYGDKVYFGTGSGISTSGSTGNFAVADADSLELLYYVGLLGYPQSSLLLSTAYLESEGLLYFYSTYNMSPGGISLIKVDPTKNTAEGAELIEIYDAAGFAQYCIASVICDINGTLYYKNDSGNVFAVGKTDAYLTALQPDVGVMTPVFAGEKLIYDLVVPVGTESVTFTYDAPAGAAVTVNGTDSPVVTLAEGAATAQIVVSTATKSRTYTVNIREIGTNSALSELRVNESNSYSGSIKTITPAFAADTLDYAAVKLGSSRTFTNVWPTAADANATVKVLALYNVDDYETGEEIPVTAVNSNHNRYAIYYADGCTTCAVEILVISEEGMNSTSYTLILTKNNNADDGQLAVTQLRARQELENYKDAADYRAAQQEELTAAIEAGKSAIDAAENTEAVAAALANAKNAIDAIKTDAELTAEELAAAKSDAKAELEDYKDPADYREAQQTELAAAVAAGKDAIDAAETVDAVAAALTDAKAMIDDIPTAAELTADELAAAKADAKSELSSYKTAADYREAQQAELAAAVAAGKDAIENAENTEAVATALADAKNVIDAIKTDAELTAEELAAARADAKAELEDYKDPDDYREAQQAELAAAVAAGKDAIDAAETIDAVAAALTDAKTVIDNIKTDADLIAEELAAAKSEAKVELEGYKDASDYREAQQVELAAAVAAGKDAIDAAENADAVAAALADAKNAVDAIKTDAELTAEELAAAKTAAKAELAGYKNEADYREAQQTELATAIETGNAAIDAAQTVAAVEEALAAAKSAIDEIKTDAQLTAEEKEEEELCPFCHEKHEGFWGAFVKFIHKILNFFKLISTK